MISISFLFPDEEPDHQTAIRELMQQEVELCWRDLD